MVDGQEGTAPRTKISDLVTEYLLHPNSKHLYVEGDEDRAVLLWYVDSVVSRKVFVITAENVEVTEKEWLHHGLNGGNKDKLVILARELDKHLSSQSKQALCIVDADFDYLLNRTENNRFLVYTDGTSMDMYTFTEPVLKRVLMLGIRDTNLKPTYILDILYTVLNQIFVIRAANELLEWNMEWLNHNRRCVVQPDGTISFDKNKFIREYLMKNGALSKKDEFCTCIDQLSRRPVQDRCQAVRGHDFTDLVGRYLRKVCRKTLVRDVVKNDGIVRMLYVALERVDLDSNRLFQRVTSFFSN